MHKARISCTQATLNICGIAIVCLLYHIVMLILKWLEIQVMNSYNKYLQRLRRSYLAPKLHNHIQKSAACVSHEKCRSLFLSPLSQLHPTFSSSSWRLMVFKLFFADLRSRAKNWLKFCRHFHANQLLAFKPPSSQSHTSQVLQTSEESCFI